MLYAHFGTFDVENYGDLLFPRLLERRFASTDVDVDVVHVSPRGGPPVWSDCVPTISAEAIQERASELSGVIIGGGNILSDQPTTLQAYASNGRALRAYPSLWVGAAQAARTAGCPLVWNAPGVPSQWSRSGQQWLRTILRASSHVAVRDVPSALRLREIEGPDVSDELPIQVAPDPAIEVRSLWTTSQLEAARDESLRRLGTAPDSRYFVVHIKRRWADHPDAIADAIHDAARRLQARPLLIPIGRCHGDHLILPQMRQLLTERSLSPLVLDTPHSLCEVTALLAHATCVIASSLHAAIVATCFGRLSISVVPHHATTRDKFESFQPVQCGTHHLVDSWESLGTLDLTRQISEVASSPPPTELRSPPNRHTVFHLHWIRLRRALESPVPAALAALPPDFATEAYRDLAMEQAKRLPSLLAELTSARAAISEAQLARDACKHTLKEQQRSHRQHVQSTNRTLKKQSQRIEQLEGWIEQLEYGVSELLKSSRWRLGNRCGDLYRAARRRPKTPLATDLLADVFARYHRHRTSLAATPQPPRAAAPSQPVPPTRPLPSGKLPSADVVICVHNALADTRRCLESVRACFCGPDATALRRVILVDDGSDPPCAEYLRDVAAQDSRFQLLRNPVATGYTRAANQGLQAGRSEVAVLLNSDTIVTRGWLLGILECLVSDARIAAAGPLSNAASWQTVPHRFTDATRQDRSDWMVNPLPEGMGVNDTAAAIRQLSARTFPRVPLLNGFCLAVRRQALTQVGHLDEQAFPRGYGEENDLCFRLRQAGYELAVADQVYVYHAKSKSYSHSARRKLSRAANRVLSRRWGRESMEQATREMRDHDELRRIRQRVQQWYASGELPDATASEFDASLDRYEAHDLEPAPTSPSTRDPWPASEQRGVPRILFLLPVRGGGGGAHSVVQEAFAMRNLGVDVRVAIPDRFTPDYRQAYPETRESSLFVPYENNDDLLGLAGVTDIVIGTIYHSMSLVQKMCSIAPELMGAYYVQDYEPWFFAEGTSEWHEARHSYSVLPRLTRFAKTRWLAEQVRREHGLEVAVVPPGIDSSLYFPTPDRFAPRTPSSAVRLSAMIRPATPRRAAARTLRVLEEVRRVCTAPVRIDVFGCTAEEAKRFGLSIDGGFRNHGVLSRGEVAKILQRTDVFVDLSDYQAFGRTALEAMACGATAVVPSRGGASEYAVHEHNSLIVDTRDENDCTRHITRLADNEDLRVRLQAEALQTAARFSIQRAVVGELQLLCTALQDQAFTSDATTSIKAAAPDSPPALAAASST